MFSKVHSRGSYPHLRQQFFVTTLLILSMMLCSNWAHSQTRVDLIESGETAQGRYYEYRIVGASFSAVEQLKHFEQVNLETQTFTAFNYDESTHICRVEVGKIGGDRDEALIRKYLGHAVGMGRSAPQDDPRTWEDDDPRHSQVEQEMPNAIPEPTNPDSMPDWGHLLNQKPQTQEEGGEF